MTRTKKRKSPVDKGDVINVQAADEVEGRKKVAAVYLSPELSALEVVRVFQPGTEVTPVELMAELRTQQAALAAGDMSRIENMLLGQAMSLQMMFGRLATQGQSQQGISQIQCLVGLALRAQSQCLATLQTLAEIKHPKPATFIGQANIAGQQQVNNGREGSATNTLEREHARSEQGDRANELLKDGTDEAANNRLDLGAQAASSGADQELETVGRIDGTEER